MLIAFALAMRSNGRFQPTDHSRRPRASSLQRSRRFSMSFVFRPYQLLAAVLAGWVNREQQQRLEYQHAEIQVLKEVVGKKRIVLNDVQRRRLAVHGKILGRKALGEIATLFSPDTILRWHRQL